MVQTYASFEDRLDEGVFRVFEVIVDTFFVFVLLILAPTAFDQGLHDHGIAGENVSCKVRELFGLVVVVRVLRIFDRVLDQLLKSCLLANELDELGLAATTAEDHEALLLVEEFLNGAALLLVE